MRMTAAAAKHQQVDIVEQCPMHKLHLSAVRVLSAAAIHVCNEQHCKLCMASSCAQALCLLSRPLGSRHHEQLSTPYLGLLLLVLVLLLLSLLDTPN
jgi:hypothetical protein